MKATINSIHTYRGRIEAATIEVEISKGIGIHLVGLPDAACKETLLRVVTAMQASGYHCPGRRIVINVSTKRIDKGYGKVIGTAHFDLPIALGILIADGQITPANGEKNLFLGELRLDGKIAMPYCGLDNEADAARVIDFAIGEAFDNIIGWPCDRDFYSWKGAANLKEVIEFLTK